MAVGPGRSAWRGYVSRSSDPGPTMIPPRPPLSPAAAKRAAAFHSDAVKTVADAVAQNAVVVVGMSINPHVPRARKALEAAGMTPHYIELGGYHNQWKQRLAVKLWSGWPTFPQVFVNGQLIGGADETVAAIAAGTIGSAASQAASNAT
jgi:monothiol glutaredoxin